MRVAVGVFVSTRDIAQMFSSGCSYGGSCASFSACAHDDGCTRDQLLSVFIVVGILVTAWPGDLIWHICG